ncbi:MAG: ABC transporter permease, partial [Acidobacteriota bacterium]
MPPRSAARLLARLTRYDEEYAVRGDLAEEFAERLRTSGRGRAALWYWRQALFALVSYIQLSIRLGVDMLKNVMKIALRNMARYKFFSLINLAGLAAGLALSLLVLLYVRYEFSFDDFHERPNDIYRIVTKQLGNVYQGTDWWARSPAFLAETMKKEYPDVELAARMIDMGGVFRNGDKVFRELSGLSADPDFMKMFRIPVLAGQPADALREPFTIWLTRDMARKYFGAANPVGKTLLFDNRILFRVAGVIENAPKPSHLRYDFIASMSSMPEILGGDYGRQWLIRTNGSLDFATYIRLKPGADPAAVENRLLELAKRYKMFDEGFQNRFSLQPLRRIHLFSQFNFDISATNGDIRTVYILSAIGLVILLVACFNFMNLFTARSATRAKEIGVRKVLGSERKQLRLQFFGEALLFTVLASAAAVLLVRLFLPLFNTLVGRKIDFSLLARPGTLLAGGVIVLFVALVSGAYPAFLLSSWSPLPILKGAAQSGGRKTSVLRNALVCVQ